MDESESTNLTPPPTRALRCPGCGTVLKTAGMTSGAWLRCPNCGQPAWFDAPKPPTRPKPAVEALLGPPPLAPPGTQPWTPRPRPARHLGCLPAVLISVLAGVAEMLFVATFQFVRNPSELLLSGAFGFVLVMTTGHLMVAASTRIGWEPTGNDRKP